VLLSLGGELVTPALTTGCLAGITRALVMETSTVREVEIDESALRDCDGLAVLSSTRDVHPVSLIKLSDGSTREFSGLNSLLGDADRALAKLYLRTLNP
jgi:branched-subunit amino acid aminotransferase/4-amino-4-deoxychorismate lyase